MSYPDYIPTEIWGSYIKSRYPQFKTYNKRGPALASIVNKAYFNHNLNSLVSRGTHVLSESELWKIDMNTGKWIRLVRFESGQPRSDYYEFKDKLDGKDKSPTLTL